MKQCRICLVEFVWFFFNSDTCKSCFCNMHGLGKDADMVSVEVKN